MSRSTPFVYISPTHCEGSHGSGWQHPLNDTADLPSVQKVMAAMDPAVFDQDRVALVLKDDLLRPMRIVLDQKASGKELKHFILWKLKRYLPYPVDQAEVRFVPLAEPQTWLTFSLPTRWLAGLSDALKERGVACGYVGGLYATLLENARMFRKTLSLCLYADFYLLAELDARGGYQNFRTRRLPYTGENRLDRDTLVRADIEPLLRQHEQTGVLALNLAPELDADFQALSQTLREINPQTRTLNSNGTTLSRFQTCMAEKVK